GEQGLALRGLLAVLLLGGHLLADLLAQLGERLHLAAEVLGELVVQGRHLALLESLHADLEAPFLAAQLRHRVVLGESHRQLARRPPRRSRSPRPSARRARDSPSAPREGAPPRWPRT